MPKQPEAITDNNPDLTIEIPLPSNRGFARERGHGVYSTYHESAHRHMVRFANYEFALIKEMAEMMGVTPSAFMRDCSYYTARALKRRAEKKEQENAHRSDSGD